MEGSMNAPLILNDAAYGSERNYSGARLAGAPAKKVEANLREVAPVSEHA